MASNSAKTKQSSRWGSLLSGAVAGLESRLDTILAEEGTVAARNAAVSAQQDLQRTALKDAKAAGANGSSNVSRTSSTRRSTPLLSSDNQGAHAPSSRSQTPNPLAKAAKPRSSTDSAVSTSTPAASSDIDSAPRTEGDTTQTNKAAVDAVSHVSAKSSADLRADVLRKSVEDGPSDAGASIVPPVDPPKSVEDLQAEVDQVRNDHDRVELRRQEETYEYLERIDALQSKLQYLSRETSSAARQSAIEAGKSEMEKKLAEQDEKIALLMEEGQKLSKSEVTQSSLIRNLRAKSAEDSNALVDLRRRLARSENVAAEFRLRVSEAESDRAAALTDVAKLSRSQRDLSTVKSELASKDEIIAQLQRDLRESNERADDDARQRQSEALVQERRVVQSLQDDLSNAKIEQGIRDDRAKSEVSKLREQLQRETERNQGAELGLRNEITTLEGRLEIMRERTEEASTGTAGDSTAKLMRQIEMLQNQYSVASENWQGIEASLQSRVTALQKERDEGVRLENDARRKARENAGASRKLENQLDEYIQRSKILEQELAEQKARSDVLQRRTTEYENSLQEVKNAFEIEKDNWNATVAARVEEERDKWTMQQAQQNKYGMEPSFTLSGAGSPQASTFRRTPTLDLPRTSGRRSIGRQVSEVNLLSGNNSRPQSRRPSYMVPSMTSRQPEVLSPNGFSESGQSSPYFANANANIPETPSIRTLHDNDPDEAFENTSSPRRTINDVLSASTAAAGPSVQLVERMSASVRRLETEKAASKEELARLSGQRDEARKEIVSLMKEVEQKRDVDKRVLKLEQDLNDVSRRYQTTLELCGERTERVEELEADVADLKKIYRELVESTMK